MRVLRPLLAVALFMGILSTGFASDTSNGRQPGGDWAPWYVPFRVEPGSALDVSHLLDAPAGKHGFTRPAMDGSLEFADGVRARFWGVSLAWEAQFPEADAVGPVVARLAANGINMVRLTYMDYRKPKGPVVRLSPREAVLDAGYMDRLDRFAAALIDAGIYIDLSLVFGGPIDGIKLPKAQQKAVQTSHPEIIAAHACFTRALLTHRNPYTGRTWGEEPGIAFMELYNEGDVFYLRKYLPQAPETAREALDAKWRAWLKKEGLDFGPEAAAHFRAETMSATEPAKRDLRSAANRFLVDLHEARYAAFRETVRACEYGGAICGNAGGSFSPASRYAQRHAEIQVAHNYHDHPPSGRSCITTRRSGATEGFGILLRSAGERMPGKPMVLGEWDYCWPNPWRAEGILSTAAFASFQDWSGSLQFTYWSRPWEGHEKLLSPEGHLAGLWRIMDDPAAMAQYPAAALLFLRGDVAVSRGKMVHEQAAWEVGWALADPRAMQHRLFVEVAPDAGGGGSPKREELAPILKSDTGEMDYRYGEPGGLRIDSPRTQGFIGFPGECAWSTTDAVWEIDTRFAAVALSSLTSEPLSTSERILLTAVAQVENTGFAMTEKPNEGKKWVPVDRGGAPILAQIVKGNVWLRRGEKIEVHALSPEGRRARKANAHRMRDGSWRIPLGESGPALHYEILIVK